MDVTRGTKRPAGLLVHIYLFINAAVSVTHAHTLSGDGPGCVLSA